LLSVLHLLMCVPSSLAHHFDVYCLLSCASARWTTSPSSSRSTATTRSRRSSPNISPRSATRCPRYRLFPSPAGTATTRLNARRTCLGASLSVLRPHTCRFVPFHSAARNFRSAMCFSVQCSALALFRAVPRFFLICPSSSIAFFSRCFAEPVQPLTLLSL